MLDLYYENVGFLFVETIIFSNFYSDIITCLLTAFKFSIFIAMKKSLLLPVFMMLGLFISCKHEDPFKKEQKEIDAAMSSIELQAYRSFKVAFRGTAATGKDSAFDQARREVLAAMEYSVSAAADSSKHIDLMSSVKTTAELLPSIALLAKKDEDSLPTVMENIAFIKNGGKLVENDPLIIHPNASEEHAVLAALWMGTPSAPAALALYEIHKINDKEVRSVDLQIILKMARSMLYYRNKWPYHAEQSADELVKLVEKEKVYLIKNPWPVVDANGNSVTPEQAWHQVHATALLMRALVRMRMENKENEYMEDLSLFVQDAEAGGFDDEGVWSIGALVAIKNDDKEVALNYLDKLEKSKNLSADEIAAITETKKYVEKKQNKEALTAMKDKIAFARIASDYFSKQVMHSKPVTDLNKSESGKKFIEITDLGFGTAVSAAENTVDSAVEKSKNVIKDIFK